MSIETVDDLKTVLKEIGYSNKAILEILKWYNSETDLRLLIFEMNDLYDFYGFYHLPLTAYCGMR